MAFLNQPIAELISRIIVVLIAMDIHEFAHAYVAYRFGDTSARDAGRMTLDPRANINWIGFAMFVLIGFGILGSAPVNPARMRSRWGYFWAVAAGPLSNLALAAICAIPFWLGIAHFDIARDRQLFPTFNLFLTDMVTFNLLLFLFNLLPLFPLDGWSMVMELLPRAARGIWVQLRMYTYYAFFGLIALSFVGVDALNLIIGQPFQYLTNLFIFRGL